MKNQLKFHRTRNWILKLNLNSWMKTQCDRSFEEKREIERKEPIQNYKIELTFFLCLNLNKRLKNTFRSNKIAIAATFLCHTTVHCVRLWSESNYLLDKIIL